MITKKEIRDCVVREHLDFTSLISVTSVTSVISVTSVTSVISVTSVTSVISVSLFCRNTPVIHWAYVLFPP